MRKFYKEAVHFIDGVLLSNYNFDMVKHPFKINHLEGYVFYCTSLVDEQKVSIILGGMKTLGIHKHIQTAAFYGNTGECSELSDLIEKILSGFLVLLCESQDFATLFDIRKLPGRDISEPQTEKSIRGSKDGFAELISINIGLIRRRIKDPLLKIEKFQISTRSKMDVAMVYLDSSVDHTVLTEVRKSIQSINVESLIMSDRALEELILKRIFLPFPLVRYTERPDVASINICHGKIAIIVDTSSSVMLTPTTFLDHTKHVEEFRLSPLVGSMVRVIRTFCILLSFLLLPLWLALLSPTIYNHGIQTILNTTLSPFLVFQIFAIELIFEIVRIASIHIPNMLISTIGLISAIILSQVSIDLGFFYPETLLLGAISGLCSFAAPSFELSMANKYTKYLLLLFTALFGRIGFLVFLTVFIIYLSTIKVFGLPYLYPLCPFNHKEANKILIRPNDVNRRKL